MQNEINNNGIGKSAKKVIAFIFKHVKFKR